MGRITNFAEANAELGRYVPNAQQRGAYSLERMRGLMSYIGNLQNSLRVIHVAGTSGKTSTCYYAASLLKAVGHKVGLTVSPQVAEVSERVQINGEPLPEEIFCRELSEFLSLVEKSQLNPTYFEVLVAFAYWEFAKHDVDYAVVEVGLGGSLDGTNVVDRADKVCIITDIGLDHVNILGGTLPEIAAHKAGIIQPHNNVFAYKQADEVLDTFKKRASDQQAELHVLEKRASESSPAFLPLFQQRNFALALAAVQFILARDAYPRLSVMAMTEAAHVLIPGRMETFERNGKTIILDGAHNAQKLKALSESILVKYRGQSIAALVSFADGRGYRLESSLQQLVRLSNNIILTSFTHRHVVLNGSVEPMALMQLAKPMGFETIEIIADPVKAFHELLKQPEPILLVTGSFYLLNHIRPLMLEV